MQKGRPQQPTALPAQREPASIVATGAEQCSRRARGLKHLVATSSVKSGSGAGSQSSADENLLPLTARLLAAFQEIFKLFSSSPTGTVDMRSMKAALRNVGIQLSPQEMCEALQQADLDGDGTVSFKDFLGVLTDSHRLAQCLGQVRNSRFYDPQGLQTLFLEMLFKLMSQGFLPHKVVQEVMSYYTKKQRALRLNPGWKGQARGPSGAVRTHASLTFFCQAARLGGLSGAELERSLHRLHKAGAPRAGWGPTGGANPDSGPAGRTSLSLSSSRPPRGQVRAAPTPRYLTWPGGHPQKTGRGTEPHSPTSDFPSPASPAATNSGPPRGPSAWVRAAGGGGTPEDPEGGDAGPRLGRSLRKEGRVAGQAAGLGAGRVERKAEGAPTRSVKESSPLDPPHAPPPPEFVGQPLDYLRPSRMAPSPPTLVQQQPFSPSPACLQKPAMKNVYK
ncbi:uncharacterized protein LOC121473038 isoform X1 [Vulpes lagopus]|uniref:uncharacterized protein LOC121473038 isoform X1 n=1 Tax=Vulpes lagopus TaxID=494514 RepID=UPI001BCA58FF|nr:uncharacterized protein LOC121473038 isoform X1 [Vulpes lagopus]